MLTARVRSIMSSGLADFTLKSFDNCPCSSAILLLIFSSVTTSSSNWWAGGDPDLSFLRNHPESRLFTSPGCQGMVNPKTDSADPKLNWSPHEASNPEPSAYKAVALAWLSYTGTKPIDINFISFVIKFMSITSVYLW